VTRVIWILSFVSLAAGCQPQLLPPDAGRDADGRGLFADDNPTARALAEELAYEHVDTHADRLLQGLSGLSDLATRRVHIRHGLAHVRLQQRHHDVPVLGAEAVVHLGDDGSVRSITDRWARDLHVDPIPTVSSADALDQVLRREGPSVDDPQAELFVMRHRGHDRLVWRVALTQLDGTDRSAMPVTFVDAHTGEVVRRYDNLQTASSSHATTAYNGTISFPVDPDGSDWVLRSTDDGVGTYDLGGEAPGWLTSSSLTDITASSVDGFTDEAAIDAHFGAVQTHAYFAAMHGRDGIDGQGGPSLTDGVTVSAVHYGDGVSNAYWNGSAMMYGDGNGWTSGPLTSLDIAAHEMTHGVTQHTAGLIYDGESGALNEGFSDMFGALVEQYVEGDGDDNWSIGEDCWTPHTSGDALRYMTDPTADGSSRDHYDTRYVGTADNGGVHWNSGIANLAFHLMVEGGDHPDPAHHVVTVQGIGWDAAGTIAYEALTSYLTPSSDFFDGRAAMVDAAESLYGVGSAEATATANAWAEVGVGAPVSGEEPTEPAEPIEPTEPAEPIETGDALDQTGLTGEQGEELLYAVEVPADAELLTVRITGGTGDADLYVRHGAPATDADYDCRPYQGGNEELCELADPAEGTWYIGVRGYLAFYELQLIATVEAPQAEPAPTHGSLDEVITATQGDEAHFALAVGPGADELVVTLSGGTGDGDLYVKQGDSVSQGDWDCRPYRSGNEETCTLEAPAEGTVSVMVHAWADVTDATLTATVH